MRRAFHRVDEMLADPDSSAELSSLANEGTIRRDVCPEWMGTTAVVCSMQQERIVVANAGDSRAVLCRGGKAIDLSEDHKPGRKDERARIERAGGTVSELQCGSHRIHRVNGVLSVSRAIGDLVFKQSLDHVAPEKQVVCSTPDVRILPRGASDEFLVLACDGVWDVLSSQKVVDLIRPHLRGIRSGHVKADAVAKQVLERCVAPSRFAAGGIGCDNMTILIACL